MVSQPTHDCAVWHGWANIPFDQTPHHVVQNGHSFVIGVSQRPAQDQHSTTDALPQGEHDYQDAHEPGVGTTEIVDQATSLAESSISHDPEQDLSVHVFRLAHTDAHCYVNLAILQDPILYDVTRHLRIRRNSVITLHYLRAIPAGIHADSEDAVILQSIQDIPAGSDEKLILLDTEIHFHPLSSGLSVPPATSRKVMRVLP